jgi:5,10-methylenetetrahydromethanopterin reductase
MTEHTGSANTLRTAITLDPAASPALLARCVQMAEELGFSYCYVADQGFSRDVYVTLASLAGVTQQIFLGPGVTHPYTRHPAAAAVAIATLDEISGGRAFLGVGAGGARTLAPLQIEQRQPLQRCREMVEIARLLWSGGKASYQGEHFSLAEAGCDFDCRSGIEIHWAARGTKMLRLGGELADVVMIQGIPHFDLENVMAAVREGAATAGRTVRLQYSVPLAFDATSMESARQRTAFRLLNSAPHVKTRLRLSAEREQEIRRLMMTGGPAAAAPLVTDEVLHSFVVDGDAAASARFLLPLFQQYRFDGLTIELATPDEASRVLPHAAEVIRALTRARQSPAGANAPA